MGSRQIVVLANSVKHSQHCVAGKILGKSEWVRPVSDKHGSELSTDQAKCSNPYGKFNVKPLQKVEIDFKRHVPLVNQPENYQIRGTVWKQKYCISIDELDQYIDSPKDLWGRGNSVSFEAIQSGDIVIDQSLYLVKVSGLRLEVTDDHKRRVKFQYNKIDYELPATDPNFGRILASGNEPKGILCVSLGEKFHGYCYKLVATIF